MQTKTRSKPLIGMTALSLLVGLSLASNSEVKNDLSHAVQSIHQVIFAPNARPSTSNTIELKAEGTQVQIQGKVLNTSAGMRNSLLQNSQNSQLYYGKKNRIEGNSSAILYGRNNTIKGNQNVIIGGYNNKIGSKNTSSHNNVIIGGRDNNINESSSIIIGGSDNIINGSNNLILAGKQTTIKGNNTYVLGSYINNQDQSNNFIWSDNKRRRDRRLQPTSSNSFIIRSANGVSINTSTPLGQGVTVNGMVQLANENLTCNDNTLGAMKFEEIIKNRQTEGCFFACEKHGSEIKWFPMAKEACGAKEVSTKKPENPVPPAPTPINGQCAPAKNTCTVGTVQNQGENSTHFTWQCEGSNGGSSASCSLEKPAAPVVPTCSIELRGNHINGDRIEVPANGFQYQIDGYTISTQGNQGTYQIQLDNSWTNSEPHTWTNDGRIVYFGKFDNGQSVRFDINNTWQGNFPIRIKNIVDGKVLCERTYTVVKDQVPEGPQSCNMSITFKSNNLIWGTGTKSSFLYAPAQGFQEVHSQINGPGFYFRINSDLGNSYRGTFQIGNTQGIIDYSNKTRPIWSLGKNHRSSENDYLITINSFDRNDKVTSCNYTFKLVQCGQGSFPTEHGCMSPTFENPNTNQGGGVCLKTRENAGCRLPDSHTGYGPRLYNPPSSWKPKNYNERTMPDSNRNEAVSIFQPIDAEACYEVSCAYIDEKSCNDAPDCNWVNLSSAGTCEGTYQESLAFWMSVPKSCKYITVEDQCRDTQGCLWIPSISTTNTHSTRPSLSDMLGR